MQDNWLFGEKTTRKLESHGAKYDSKRADKNIKKCPACKCCWEVDTEQTKHKMNREAGRIVYMYYENFPSYGKEIELCDRCE